MTATYMTGCYFIEEIWLLLLLNVCVILACAIALRWLREDVDIPDSQLYITLSDFEVSSFCY